MGVFEGVGEESRFEERKKKKFRGVEGQLCVHERFRSERGRGPWVVRRRDGAHGRGEPVLEVEEGVDFDEEHQTRPDAQCDAYEAAFVQQPDAIDGSHVGLADGGEGFDEFVDIEGQTDDLSGAMQVHEEVEDGEHA